MIMKYRSIYRVDKKYFWIYFEVGTHYIFDISLTNIDEGFYACRFSLFGITLTVGINFI